MGHIHVNFMLRYLLTCTSLTMKVIYTRVCAQSALRPRVITIFICGAACTQRLLFVRRHGPASRL